MKKTTTDLIEKADKDSDWLTPYVPDGLNPKSYLRLVENVMGVDKNGSPRPAEDLMTFLHVAKKAGLDPMAHQIYAVYRWDSNLGREKMTIQTGIDGLRLIAQRSGEYGGQEETKYEERDGLKHPISATVTVIKVVADQVFRIPATARWDESVSTNRNGEPMGLWGSKPYTMLEKVAESKALRKAFPAEMTGIYSSEEYSHDDIRKSIPEYKPQEEQEPSTLTVNVDESKL